MNAMIKKLLFLLTISAGIIIFSVPSNAFAQQVKIAAVDMSKVFNEYSETKKAEADFKERMTSLEKELTERKSKLQKYQEDLKVLSEDAESHAFTEEKKAEKRRAFEVKAKDFELERQNTAEWLQGRQQNYEEQKKLVRVRIVGEISKVIQDKAKQEGYTVVIDSSKDSYKFGGWPPFLSVQDSLDITSDVIKMLNAATPSGSSKEKDSEKSKDSAKDSKKDTKDTKK